TAGTSTLNSVVADQIKVGEVQVNKTLENHMLISSVAHKLIISALTEIDIITSTSITTDELISENSTLTTAAVKELNIGGVSLSEDLGLDLNIESTSNKVSISAPVEVTKLT